LAKQKEKAAQEEMLKYVGQCYWEQIWMSSILVA